MVPQIEMPQVMEHPPKTTVGMKIGVRSCNAISANLFAHVAMQDLIII